MGPNIGINLQHDNFSIGDDFGRAFFQCKPDCSNRLYNATLGNAICLDFIKRNPKTTTAIWSRLGSIRFIFLNGARFQRVATCIFRGDLHTCRRCLFRSGHSLDEAKEMAEQPNLTVIAGWQLVLGSLPVIPFWFFLERQQIGTL